MYESHFGLSGSPFQLNPDPAFYFDSRGHSNALAYLKFGAHQGEGFIVVTGEIGAGKTTLVRTLLGGLNPEQVVAAQVVSTQLESGELLQAILMSFGIASASNSKAHLIGSLEAFLTVLAAKGRRALLIIDEAQNLKHEAVEELRMLSNFQLGKYGLLQSFLVGQPELRQLLQSKSMEQLRQRVIASCHLGPLDPPETRAYIEHRLRLVGWSGRPEFAVEAFERIHIWTGGVPRKINRLCNRLLLGAFLGNEESISPQMVDRTATELRSEIGELSEIPESHPPAAAPVRAEPPVAKAAATVPEGRHAHVAPLEPAAAEVGEQAAVHDSRPKVRLVPGAAANGPSVEGQRPLQAEHGGPGLLPGAKDELPVVRGAAVAGKAEGRGPLMIVPATKSALEGNAGTLASEPPLSRGAAPEGSDVQRRTYRAGGLHRPLICLVDSASDFLKAGTLTEVFLKFPALPRLIAVHPGCESDLSFGDTGANELPMPFVGLHIDPLPTTFAEQVPQVLRVFEGILNEFDPQAVLVMGSSDAVLACSLLANKRGTPLLRIGGGQRRPDSEASTEVNGPMIDRLSNALYVNRMDSYYTLYQEGIKSDRVLCVGNLIGDMLKNVLPHTPSPSAIFLDAKLSQNSAEALCGYALVTIDVQKGFASAGALLDLGAVVCALASELPIVWPISDTAAGQFEASGMAVKLRAAKIVLLPAQGYLQHLGLLEGAKCLIAGPEGSLVEEADSLKIPSLRLDYAESEASLVIDGESALGVASPQRALATMRRHLAAPTAPQDSPAYWDSGTATRIANHLLLWLPKSESASYAKA